VTAETLYDGSMGEGRGRWPLGAQTVRVNWTLRKSAKAIAERAGAGEGTSQGGYVSALVEACDAEWQAALEYLLDREWKKRDLREVLEAIPRPPAFPTRPLRTVSSAGVEITSETDARALLVLAREAAAGNAELQKRLR
jgi:hypothetical protein